MVHNLTLQTANAAFPAYATTLKMELLEFFTLRKEFYKCYIFGDLKFIEMTFFNTQVCVDKASVICFIP